MNTSARLLIIIVLIVGASSFASAEIISYSGDVTFTGLGQSANIEIPRFDTSLGTLNSVTVTFWDSGQGIFSATARNSIATARGTIDRGYQVTGAGLNFSNQYEVPGQRYTNLAPGATIGPETISFSNPTAENFIVAPGDRTLYYSGTGNLAYIVSVPAGDPYNFLNSQTVSSGGDLVANFTNSNEHVGTTVTYNYTSDPGVPEPSSLALLPMALTGLMFWRRRRTA